MAHRPSGIPAWGGGSGSRMASTAAAAKLRTVKDKERTRSASAAGFRTQSEAASSAQSSAGWGFSASPPEPVEEENCPAVTPTTTPVKADCRPVGRELDDGDVGAAPAAAVERHTAAPIPVSTAATALPTDAWAALQALAGALTAAAAARGPAAVQLHGGASWETAFLAGVAVGLQLPAASRCSTAVQRALLAMALICALVVLGGSALLLAGVTQAQPVMYFS